MLHEQMQVAFLGLLMSGTGSVAFGRCADKAAVSDSVRGGFISAAYGEHADVTVEVLSAAGCGQALLGSLDRLGAEVRFVDERVGYAQIVLPKDKVLDVLDLPGAAAAVVDANASRANPYSSSFVPFAERRPAPVPPIAVPFPRVATDLPPGGPYFAADEAGLTAFWQKHPEADGRGVRVAVLDSGFDLLHPALQMAKDRDGNLVPKVADIIILSAPNDKDPGWVQFGEPIQVVNGTFAAAGRSWTAPHDGSLRFGMFARTIFLNGMNGSMKELAHSDVNVPLSVGVLWDEGSNRVWVDTDGDGSFLNQPALGDYGSTHDIDYFGRKEGGNDNRIAFGVKIDRVKKAAYLSITDGGHGTLVAGPLAANRLTGGLFDGAAPNAQLIDARDFTSLTRMMLTSFARADVDILNRSGWLGLPADDESVFLSLVLARAILVYDKPVACYCGATNAVHVQDYQSAEMLKRNRQLPPPYGEAINSHVWFTSDGLVNTILAPSASLGTQSRYMPFAIPREDGRLHMTDIMVGSPAPAGYMIGANPSPTIPIVSGVLADLMSEAQREHVRYNAVRLTQALFTGTRWVSGFPASLQGFGLVNAAGAWDQLTKMAGADDPSNPVLTSFAVTRVLQGQRAEVNGFQADLPLAAGTVQGELWITRRGGYARGRDYRLALRGDDGSYTLLDREIVLSQDQPARVRFSAKVRSGLHLAFLQLIDAKAEVVMQEVPLSLKAPGVPEILAPGVEKYQRTIPPLHSDELYVRMGEDVQATRFAMRIPYGGPAFISGRSMPGFAYGVVGNRVVAMAPPSGAALDAAHHVGPMEEFESLIANTKPGTQVISWGNRSSPEYATPYDPPAPDVPITGTVVVTRYAVGFNRVNEGTMQVTNKLAAVEGKVEFYTAPLTATVLTGARTHAVSNLDRELPAHLNQWRVHVSSTAGAGAPADAFLLNCTGKAGCAVAAQKPVSEQGATLVVDNPREGNWKIVVRARDRLERPTSYRVQEAAVTAAGDATQTVDKKFASGETWLVSLPAKTSDALYAAFRMAGIPGKDDQKDGLRIAMTALTPVAP
jgi:hypothetical protein